MNTIKITRTMPDAIIPTQAHKGDAGYDLYAITEKDQPIMPLQSYTFNTGIAIEIPEGYVGLVFARSGLGIKKGLTPRNCVGVIDSGYRGEIKVCLYNDNSSDIQIITNHERIAQIVIVPFYEYEFVEVDTLDETERGENGFGSSGRK